MAKKNRFPSSTLRQARTPEWRNLESDRVQLPTNYQGFADKKLEELTSQTETVKPYRKAKVVRGKRWYLDFYAYCPVSGQMKRKRLELDLNNQTVINQPELREAKAEQYRKEIDTALARGKQLATDSAQPTARRQTLIQALRWVHEQKKLRLTSNSDVHYWNSVAHLIGFLRACNLQSIKPADLASHHYQRFEDYLRAYTRNRSQRSIINTVTTVNSYLNDLVKYNVIGTNPFRGLLRKGENLQDNVKYWSFSKAQLGELKTYFLQHDPYIWQFALCIFHAFIRPKELRFLQCRYIDQERGVIYVPQYGTDVNGQRFKVAKKQPGEVQVFPELANVIAELRPEQYPPDYFLFSANRAPGPKPLSKNWPYNHFRSGLVACGYPVGSALNGYSLYGMKHSGNEQYYHACKDIELLRRQNRHKYSQTTDLYLRKLNLDFYKANLHVSI